MTILQDSTAVRNATLDARETAIGTAPRLRYYSGALPTNCAAARTGTLLGEKVLPSDWMTNASAGVKAMQGVWDTVGLAAGNIGYFSIMDNAGATCHQQGDVTATGGGGAMTVDNINTAVGQPINVTAFQYTAPGA